MRRYESPVLALSYLAASGSAGLIKEK